MLQRAGYFVINSLIIFVMAFGANALGVSASRNRAEAKNGAQHAAIMREVPADRAVVLASYDVPAPRFDGSRFRASPNPRGLQLAGDEGDKKQNTSSGFFRTWSWTGA